MEPVTPLQKRKGRRSRKGGDQTRAELIQAAETMIGEQGVDKISVRQIGIAIGSLNTNVVAYHFGSKEALIEAVIHFRLPEIDKRRSELLAEADRDNQDYAVTALMRALWQPLREQRNEHGQHSYGRFLASLARSGFTWPIKELGQRYPASTEINRRLQLVTPVKGEDLFIARFQGTMFIITNALDKVDREQMGEEEADRMFDDALRMSAAAMTAPSS
jgi:AcrR family transcriptional regulator